MRDLETIASDLRLIAAVRRAVVAEAVIPITAPMDELPDERLAQCGRASKGHRTGDT